jgi:hypothetical protein
MPFELTWESRGVLRRYHGDVSIVERERSFNLICSDARFDDIRYSITDYLDVDRYEIDPVATEEIAARHIGPLLTNPHIVIAAVAVDDRILAAIEHFIATGFVTRPYRVFDTLAAAREWIAREGFPLGQRASTRTAST